ncbi:MFS transporter [Streptomyces sp. NPDC001978]|uniref:MFS transporter n=1 Tax=Streptomyces sp. NPDC001978 TaxID=3364627 RepID=UPI0036B21C80
MTQTLAPPAVSRRPSATLTFALLATSAGAFAMLQSLISPVLPTVQHALHTSQSGVAWVLLAWLLCASVATPILGRVGDMIGKKKTLLVILGALAAGSLISALAPNLAWMIVGRLLQGLGGAIYPISYGIIRDEFDRDRVPSAIGAMSSVIGAGGGVALVLAGPITDGLGWRWLFWIPLIILTAVGVLTAFFVPESKVRTGGRIDWFASLLLAVWLLALLLPVSEGQEWGWGSPATIALFAVAVVAFIGWVVVESRSANPVVDMRMMRQTAVWATNLVALLVGASVFSAFTFLPQFIETPRKVGYGFGSSVTMTGVIMLPILVTMAVGGMISGPLRKAVDFKTQLVLSCALLGAGSLSFAFWNHAAWEISIGCGIFGLGVGVAYSAMISVIIGTVNPTQTGAATGMNTNLRNIGGAIGTAVVTAVITSTTGVGGLPTHSGYRTGWLLLVVIAAIAVTAALLIPSPPAAHGSAEHADSARQPAHSK